MRRTRAGLVVVALCGGCFNPPARDSDPGTTGAPHTTGDPDTTAAPLTTADAPTTTCGGACSSTTTTTGATGETSTTATTGDGPAFVQVASIPVASPFALVAGRFDDLDNLDLMVTSSKTGVTRISGGSWDAQIVLPDQPASLAIAVTNFDVPDQYDDVIILTESSTLGTFLTEDPGVPMQQWAEVAPCGARSMVLADLVGDPYRDIVLVCPGMTQLFAYTGTGGPIFATPYFVHEIGVSADALAVANVVDTLAPDFLIASGVTGEALVYPGQDGVTFAAPLDFPLLNPNAIAVDLASPAEYHDAVVAQATGCVRLAGSDVGVSASGAFDCGAQVVDLALGDLDQDGDLDLVTLGEGLTSPTLSIYTSDELGQFTPLATHEVGKEPRRLLLADLDADSRLDIAVTTGATVDIFRNDL